MVLSNEVVFILFQPVRWGCNRINVPVPFLLLGAMRRGLRFDTPFDPRKC
jgi:hypothetical protein